MAFTQNPLQVRIFIHKIPWLDPDNTFQAVQLSLSKVLIFAVLSFVLYLFAKNFLSHTHNSIVNRHRKNALMTYRALSDAAGDHSGQDAILIHAAACIYSPQPTGYTSNDLMQLQGSKSIVELLAKPIEKT